MVLEGCEVTTFLRPDELLSLAETSDLGSIRSGHGVHLTGGASLYPFVGHFVKNILTNPEILPVNYFCVGRQYRTQGAENPVSLFHPQQSTAAQLFSVSSSDESMHHQIDDFVDVLEKFYDNLGLHYRIGIASVSQHFKFLIQSGILKTLSLYHEISSSLVPLQMLFHHV